MAEAQWWGKQKGQEREVTIAGASLLCNKAGEKRIKIGVHMPLTGSKLAKMPEWINKGMIFVAQNHEVVTSDKVLPGYDIRFDDNALFTKGKTGPRCTMKGFVIREYGDADGKEVELAFNIYAPFQSSLWTWLGQYGGKDCWLKFEEVELEGDGFELASDDEADDDADPRVN